MRIAHFGAGGSFPSILKRPKVTARVDKNQWIMEVAHRLKNEMISLLQPRQTRRNQKRNPDQSRCDDKANHDVSRGHY